MLANNVKQIPLLLATVIGPLMTIRATSAFCFTFFYRLMKKRQNPDLEILRMGVLCVPIIVILYTFIVIRKVDTAIKERELAPIQYRSSENIAQDYSKGARQYEGELLLPIGHQRH